MYLDEHGQSKGDCTICYVAESSADMALQVLDGGYIRPSSTALSVTRAEFQKRAAPSGEGAAQGPARKKPTLTAAQIKVAQNATAQSLAWNEDDDVGVSRAKALKIVVIENMFDPRQVDEEHKGGDDTEFFEELERDVASEAEKCGEIDKITLFSRSPQGAIIIKYCTSYAAQECVRMFDGRIYDGRKLRCKFWDGVMDYTSVSVPTYEEQQAGRGGGVSRVDAEDNRLDAFGDWLDNEQDDLPEEFRLRVE
jgi:HIV Tat-specific factor 1